MLESPGPVHKAAVGALESFISSSRRYGGRHGGDHHNGSGTYRSANYRNAPLRRPRRCPTMPVLPRTAGPNQ